MRDLAAWAMEFIKDLVRWAPKLLKTLMILEVPE